MLPQSTQTDAAAANASTHVAPVASASDRTTFFETPGGNNDDDESFEDPTGLGLRVLCSEKVPECVSSLF